MLKDKLKSENLIIAGFIFLIVLVTTIYIFRNGGNHTVIEKNINIQANKSPTIVDTAPPDEVKVYVVGAVNNPGVVIIKKGQIIEDAVKLAGGFKPDADIENINMVYKINENIMLKIKSKNDQQTNNDIKNDTNASKNNNTLEKEGNTGSKGVGFEIINDSNGSIETDNSKGSDSKHININKATKEELMKLPGIGKSYAEKIIQYREKTSVFKTKEDIKNVPGIGEAKYNAIKDLITIE